MDKRGRSKLESNFEIAEGVVGQEFGIRIFKHIIERFGYIGVNDKPFSKDNSSFFLFTPYENCVTLNKKEYLEETKSFIQEYERSTGIKLKLIEMYPPEKKNGVNLKLKEVPLSVETVVPAVA